jgi:hypothetical protein
MRSTLQNFCGLYLMALLFRGRAIVMHSETGQSLVPLHSKVMRVLL